MEIGSPSADIDTLKTEYAEATPRSAAAYARARKVMPGGNTRATLFVDPYPPYTAQADGAYVFDVDGNKRLDLANGMFVIQLGHANAAINDAVSRQLALGTCYSTPTELEVRFAELIQERMPSLERTRFSSTGSEATMNIIRIAKAFTGRGKLAKFEGGFHGSHELVEISIEPSDDGRAGADDRPLPVIESPGVLQEVTDETVMLPWNDPEAVERIVRENRDDLAAIIAEPVLGGSILPPEPGFLQELRRIADENDVLLIFDEIITCRLAYGGAQSLYGVTADLITSGKPWGGGFPVGVFGGRADLMEITDPTSPKFSLKTLGTFTANPITMAAGIAALEQLTPDVYEPMNEMGEGLRSELKQVFDRHGVPAQVTGVGALFCFHFNSREIRCYRDLWLDDLERKQRFFWWLINHGVLVHRSLRACLTTAWTAEDAEYLVKVADGFARAESA